MSLNLPTPKFSYSQARKAAMTPWAYYLQYVEKIKTLGSAALLLGSSVDQAATAMNKRKIDTGEIIDVEMAAAIHDKAFMDGKARIKFEADEDPGTFKDKGETLTRIYHEKILIDRPMIFTQKWFTLDFEGEFKFQGIIDRIDLDRPEADIPEMNKARGTTVEVVDLKTTKTKKKDWFSEMDRIQFIGNTVGAREDLGLEVSAFRGEYMITGVKSPYLRDPAETTTGIRQEDIDEWGAYIVHQARFVDHCMTAGHFPASCYQSGWWCSEKWCGHYGKTCYLTGGKGPRG